MSEEYRKSNREKRMSPKSDGRFWCYGCDDEQVYEGEKCSNCEFKHHTKTIKKETNSQFNYTTTDRRGYER